MRIGIPVLFNRAMVRSLRAGDGTRGSIVLESCGSKDVIDIPFDKRAFSHNSNGTLKVREHFQQARMIYCVCSNGW